MFPPGAVVAWWDRNELAFGAVVDCDADRVRLVRADSKDQRLPASKVMCVVGAAEPSPGGHAGDRQRLARHVERVATSIGSAAGDIDVAVLWELAVESPSTPGLGPLATLAIGRDDGRSRATVACALARDGLHFARRGAEWEPRDRQTVLSMRLERDRLARKESEREAALSVLRAAWRGEPFVETAGREETRYVRALEELAVQGGDASAQARDLALQALEPGRGSFDTPEEGAFRLLRRLGRFESDDENLQILKYRVRVSFPDAVLRAAREAAERAFAPHGREDLEALDVLTIDGAETREIDDGLSIEARPGGAARLGIHIADPTAFVETGGALDDEALARTVSYYFPERRIPMLPEAISHDAASLLPGVPRPALSFVVDLGPGGEVIEHRIVRSMIRSRQRLDYHEADRAIADGRDGRAAMLRDLAARVGLLESARVSRGAVRLLAPEVEARVTDGRIELDRIDPSSPARRMVAEAMILAGTIAARFCRDLDLPAIYRRQAAPADLTSLPADGVSSPVEVRALRRRLHRAEASLDPGPHFALGLSAYCQVTSPLRRYQDLILHRQIAAALEGRPPRYDREGLQRIAASTERAEIEARRAEAAADRYWLLRHLAGQVGRPVRAVVVELDPRPIVVLEETGLEQAVAGLAGVAIGDRVSLRVAAVNPRADRLVLRA